MSILSWFTGLFSCRGAGVPVLREPACTFVPYSPPKPTLDEQLGGYSGPRIIQEHDWEVDENLIVYFARCRRCGASTNNAFLAGIHRECHGRTNQAP